MTSSVARHANSPTPLSSTLSQHRERSSAGVPGGRVRRLLLVHVGSLTRKVHASKLGASTSGHSAGGHDRDRPEPPHVARRSNAHERVSRVSGPPCRQYPLAAIKPSSFVLSRGSTNSCGQVHHPPPLLTHAAGASCNSVRPHGVHARHARHHASGLRTAPRPGRCPADPLAPRHPQARSPWGRAPPADAEDRGQATGELGATGLGSWRSCEGRSGRCRHRSRRCHDAAALLSIPARRDASSVCSSLQQSVAVPQPQPPSPEKTGRPPQSWALGAGAG